MASRMREVGARRARLARLLGRTALVLLLVLALAYGAATLTTDRLLVSRWLVWRGADTDDLHRFPSRDIPAGSEDFALPSGPQLDLRTVWPSTEDPETFLRRTGTSAFLVVQNGKIRYEDYFNGARPDDLRTSFSVVKSFVSTLVGIAIADGAIGSVADPVTKYVPELLDRDARFADITIRDLLTMSSGLQYDEGSMPWTDDTLTYYGTDLRKAALSAKVIESPGETFRYNNYNLLLEGLILERATGQSVSTYLSSRVWRPMGAEAAASWSLDSAGSGFEKMESGLNALARDFARFGVLFARGGRIDGRQVVPRAWVEQATSPGQGGPADFYGFHWWTGTEKGAALPPGHFVAVGNLGQFVYVVPARDLVIVRLGDAWGSDGWLDLLSRVAEELSRGRAPR